MQVIYLCNSLTHNKDQFALNAKFSVNLERNIYKYERSLFIPLNKIQLWFPHGYGAQPIYVMEISYTPEDYDTTDKEVKILSFGFRKIELVREKDYVFGKHGESFFFRVNK